MLSSEKMMENWISKVSTKNDSQFQGRADTDTSHRRDGLYPERRRTVSVSGFRPGGGLIL